MAVCTSGARNSKPWSTAAAARSQTSPRSCSAKSPEHGRQHRLGRLEEARPTQLAGQLVGELAVGGRRAAASGCTAPRPRRSPPPRARSGGSRSSWISGMCCWPSPSLAPGAERPRPPHQREQPAAGVDHRDWSAASTTRTPPSAAGRAALSHSCDQLGDPAVPGRSRTRSAADRIRRWGRSRWRWPGSGPGAESGPTRGRAARADGEGPGRVDPRRPDELLALGGEWSVGDADTAEVDHGRRRRRGRARPACPRPGPSATRWPSPARAGRAGPPRGPPTPTGPAGPYRGTRRHRPAGT